MKVLFVQAMQSTNGFESLSAYLKSQGHEVCCFFDPMLFNEQVFNFPRLSKHFDLSDPLIEAIGVLKPGLICVSVIYDQFQWASNFSRIIKKHFDIPIVFGGIHPTAVPEKVLENSAADFVIRGEGEYALAELARTLENHEPIDDLENLVFRKNGEFQLNPLRPLIQDMDSLPFPDKDILWKANHIQTQDRYATLASRGCVYQCSFCCHSMLRKLYKGKGKYVRRRSVDNLISELEIAKKCYNAKRILIHDENLLQDEIWFAEFAEKFKKQVDLPYFCWVTPDKVDEKRVALLKSSGCHALEIGIQNSPDTELSKITGRTHQDRYTQRALELLSDGPFFVTTDNLIGLPTQTPDDIVSLINFYLKHPVDHIAVYWLRFYPGTRIINLAEKLGTLTKERREQIERGENALNFIHPRAGSNPQIITLGNLLLLSMLLPKRLVKWFLAKQSRLRFIPNGAIYLYATVFMTLKARVFRGRKRIHLLNTPTSLLFHYAYQTVKILTWKWWDIMSFMDMTRPEKSASAPSREDPLNQ